MNQIDLTQNIPSVSFCCSLALRRRIPHVSDVNILYEFNKTTRENVDQADHVTLCRFLDVELCLCRSNLVTFLHVEHSLTEDVICDCLCVSVKPDVKRSDRL